MTLGRGHLIKVPLVGTGGLHWSQKVSNLESDCGVEGPGGQSLGKYRVSPGLEERHMICSQKTIWEGGLGGPSVYRVWLHCNKEASGQVWVPGKQEVQLGEAGAQGPF